MSEEKQNVLGTERIGQLLLRFSVPTTLTLIVNSLYNMVDQIFVGRAMGVSGVAATNVAFPISVLAAALALTIGDGCASNISLALGRGEKEEANRIFSTGFLLLILVSILFVGMGLAFLTPMLLLFGATPSILDTAASYTSIVLWGIPFTMFNMAFTAIIRADGNPKYMMRTMMIGAGINLVLDPIFIFGFDMGVAGAAWATIIGQFVAGIMALAYLPKFQHIRLKKENNKISPKHMGRILKLGLPSFCTQGATAATQIVMLNLMGTFGALSIYGSEIALSCYGILSKIYQIAHAMFVGLSSGTQPINGFNFGAKQYGRVKQTYRMAFLWSMVISIVWFLIFRFGGGLLATMFVKDDPLYLEFAKHCFSLYMLGFFLYGPPLVTASFFQAVGKPWKSLAIALARQVFFLIPLGLMLAPRFGLDGALMAAPLADGLAFLFAMSMIFVEFRSWKEKGIA